VAASPAKEKTEIFPTRSVRAFMLVGDGALRRPDIAARCPYHATSLS